MIQKSDTKIEGIIKAQRNMKECHRAKCSLSVAGDRFADLLGKVVAVPKSKIDKRDAEFKGRLPQVL